MDFEFNDLYALPPSDSFNRKVNDENEAKLELHVFGGGGKGKARSGSILIKQPSSGKTNALRLNAAAKPFIPKYVVAVESIDNSSSPPPTRTNNNSSRKDEDVLELFTELRMNDDRNSNNSSAVSTPGKIMQKNQKLSPILMELQTTQNEMKIEESPMHLVNDNVEQSKFTPSQQQVVENKKQEEEEKVVNEDKLEFASSVVVPSSLMQQVLDFEEDCSNSDNVITNSTETVLLDSSSSSSRKLRPTDFEILSSIGQGAYVYIYIYIVKQ